MRTNPNLHNGDCLEWLRKLPDGFADLAITSPPYNMNLRIRNGKYCSRQLVKELSTKYDGYDDNLSMEDYFSFNKAIITELNRTAKTTFFVVQVLTGNKPAIFRLMGEFNSQIKEMIIWDKMTAEPSMLEGVMNSQFECILVFSGTTPESRRFGNAQFDRGTLPNLWKIPKNKNKHKSHKAAFPNILVDTIIDNFSVPGQIIIDPMLGTGTVGICSVKKGRQFYGCELLPHYFEIAKNTIERELNELQTQLPLRQRSR